MALPRSIFLFWLLFVVAFPAHAQFAQDAVTAATSPEGEPRAPAEADTLAPPQPGRRFHIFRPRRVDAPHAQSISPFAAAALRPEPLAPIVIQGYRDRERSKKPPTVEERIQEAANEGFFEYGHTYGKCLGPLCGACMKTGLGWSCGDPILSIGANLLELLK